MSHEMFVIYIAAGITVCGLGALGFLWQLAGKRDWDRFADLFASQSTAVAAMILVVIANNYLGFITGGVHH